MLEKAELISRGGADNPFINRSKWPDFLDGLASNAKKEFGMV